MCLDEDICKLYCIAEDFDFFFAMSSKVKDGTSCSDHEGDVCIDGVCEVWRLSSVLTLAGDVWDHWNPFDPSRPHPILQKAFWTVLCLSSMLYKIDNATYLDRCFTTLFFIINMNVNLPLHRDWDPAIGQLFNRASHRQGKDPIEIGMFIIIINNFCTFVASNPILTPWTYSNSHQFSHICQDLWKLDLFQKLYKRAQ